jgi:hypothetical protein
MQRWTYAFALLLAGRCRLLLQLRRQGHASRASNSRCMAPSCSCRPPGDAFAQAAGGARPGCASLLGGLAAAGAWQPPCRARRTTALAKAGGPGASCRARSRLEA